MPVTLGGDALRLRLSNQWGNAPLTVSEIRIAQAKDTVQVDSTTEQVVLFGGHPAVTLLAGQTLVSDVLSRTLKPLTQLAITMHIAQAPTHVTGHPGSRTTSYLKRGNAVAEASFVDSVPTEHWYFITGVDVRAGAGAAAVIALGDSITDGRGSTTNGNDRWPDHLARRFHMTPKARQIAVLNQGIGGNAVFRGGLGPTAKERFERDVLSQNGARWLIVLAGVNDIGEASSLHTARELIATYESFIDRARARGISVFGVPILPFGGSQYDAPLAQKIRERVNLWIRESGRYDAVIDLDRAVRDPANPSWLNSPYDSGDHLHLAPAGYRAMADAIDLNLFSTE